MNEKLIRRKKWWKWVAWPLGVLLSLYLIFWIALFNPLEGSVEHLESLLPGHKQECVTYCLKGPWGDIRRSEFFRDNFTESSFGVKVEKIADLDVEYARVGEIEDRINENLPGVLGEFSLEKDLLGREVLLAGYLTGRGEAFNDQLRNSPFIALTRISFKARFISALKYDFIRDQVPGLTQREDWFEYDLAEATGEDFPERDRYRYFARIKDVLAISNDEELIEKVTRYGLAGGLSTESLAQHFWYYYDTRSAAPENAVSLWLRVSQADLDLGRKLDGYADERTGGARDLLRSLFPVPYTTSMLVRVGFEGKARMPINGVIRMRDKFPDTMKHLRDVHHVDGFNLREASSTCAAALPAEGVFAFSWLRMEPRDFFKTYFLSLDEETRVLLFGEAGLAAATNGSRWDIDLMSRRLGDWFEPGVAVCISRLPEADAIDLDTWEGGVPKPIPGITLCLKIRPELDSKRLPQFLAKNEARFGWGSPEKKPSDTGELYRLPLKTDKTLALMKPGFATVNGCFLFSTNIDQLRRSLDVVAGKRESLAKLDAFNAALDTVAKKGNIFVFVDGEGLRPFLRDKRHEYAFDSSSFDAREFRKQVIIELTTQYEKWTNQQIQQEADLRVKLRMDQMKRLDFDEAIQYYESFLPLYEPFDWLGLSMTVSGDRGGQRLELKGEMRVRTLAGGGSGE